MGGLYAPEDNYVGNNLGALDALDAGITTLYDWSHNNNSPEHSDASVQGLTGRDLRCIRNSTRRKEPDMAAPLAFNHVGITVPDIYSRRGAPNCSRRPLIDVRGYPADGTLGATS
jgi:hypothetical protein